MHPTTDDTNQTKKGNDMSEQELHDQTAGIVSEVLDLIASDAEFREALKADPAAAMEAAGFAAKIDGLLQAVEDDAEVSGFASFAPTIGGLSRNDLLGSGILASNTGTMGCPPNLQNRYLGDAGGTFGR